MKSVFDSFLFSTFFRGILILHVHNMYIRYCIHRPITYRDGILIAFFLPDRRYFTPLLELHMCLPLLLSGRMFFFCGCLKIYPYIRECLFLQLHFLDFHHACFRFQITQHQEIQGEFYEKVAYTE